MENIKVLQVIIENVEFLKANYYFVTIDYSSDPDRKRTDISPAVKNPQFLANQFEFELIDNQIGQEEKLKFECHTAGHGNDSVLQGECELEVGNLFLKDNIPVKQRLKFTKTQNYKIFIIGQFIATVKLLTTVQAQDVGKQANVYSMQNDFTYKSHHFSKSEVLNDSHNGSLNNSQQEGQRKSQKKPGVRTFNNLSRYHINLDEHGQPILNQYGQNVTKQELEEEQKQNNSEEQFGETLKSQEMQYSQQSFQQDPSERIIQEQFEREPSISEILGDKLDGIHDIMQRWEVMSKELAQKQEIGHRMQKEIEDKAKGIKETGNEVVELRKKLKLITVQNQIFKKRAYAEQQIKLQSVVSPEIQKMQFSELKNRIINIATAYRDERRRNDDFQQAMKESEKEIQRIAHLEQELEDMRNKHQIESIKLSEIQNDISQKGFYQDAMHKQTQVISKLQKLMETVLLDAEKAKNAQVDLRNLQKDVNDLTAKLKADVYQDQRSDLQNLRYENQKLEKVYKLLQEEIVEKRPKSVGSDMANKWAGQNEELQVRYHKSQARIAALQDEIADNSKMFANEFAMIKLEIAQKQAQLDSLTIHVANSTK